MTAARIPVSRPKLPCAQSLTPYLHAIDEARFYSNFGPQAHAFENRLADHFGLASGTVTTVANATLGLTLALMAQGAPANSLCLMPAWTFVATAHAAVSAGLIPYFLDVEPSTWTLDPCAIGNEIARAPGPVGAIMPVMPFGQRIDVEAWEEFRRRTGLPVVIDAAAAFDSLQVREIPAVVSLHATKIVGVGEGGFVVSRDPSIIRDVRMRSNFGFDSNRDAMIAATNAKLSEYHAAIGLASLDTWPKTRAKWSAVAQCYRKEFAKSNQIQLQNGYGESWVSATCVVAVPENVHGAAQRALTNAGVETRNWWGRGAHSYPATVKFPRAAELAVTERLANSTIGLPCYQDLHPGEIRKIAETLVAAVSS